MNGFFPMVKSCFVSLLMGVLAGCAATGPRVNLAFDVAHGGVEVSQEFEIKDYRNYQFMLSFYYYGSDDLKELYRKVGSGARYPDGRYGEPGAVVPIRLKVIRQNEVLFDGVVETMGVDVHGFDARDQKNGDLNRLVKSIALIPGKYTVQAVTVKETPELLGREVYLTLIFNPKVKPLRY